MNEAEDNFISIAEARRSSGLRVILLQAPAPGPWNETCKNILHVKRLPYTAVKAVEKNGSEAALREWTAQRSAPVIIWEDEPPRSTWIEQLYLLERLGPSPQLIPNSIEARSEMFGLCNELAGENGFGWSKRLLIIRDALMNPESTDRQREAWARLAEKYRYSENDAGKAASRMISVLQMLDGSLERQTSNGSRYLIGDSISALDIYWAAFAALVRPLPDEQCSMHMRFRELYTERDPVITEAISARLLAHRDYIYSRYLELPIRL